VRATAARTANMVPSLSMNYITELYWRYVLVSTYSARQNFDLDLDMMHLGVFHISVTDICSEQESGWRATQGLTLQPVAVPLGQPCQRRSPSYHPHRPTHTSQTPAEPRTCFVGSGAPTFTTPHQLLTHHHHLILHPSPTRRSSLLHTHTTSYSRTGLMGRPATGCASSRTRYSSHPISESSCESVSALQWPAFLALPMAYMQPLHLASHPYITEMGDHAPPDAHQ
jgi:hypothetical protein